MSPLWRGDEEGGRGLWECLWFPLPWSLGTSLHSVNDSKGVDGRKDCLAGLAREAHRPRGSS